MAQFGYLIHFAVVTSAALYFAALTVFLLRSLRSQPLKIRDKNYNAKSASNLRLYRRNVLSRRFN